MDYYEIISHGKWNEYYCRDLFSRSAIAQTWTLQRAMPDSVTQVSETNIDIKNSLFEGCFRLAYYKIPSIRQLFFKKNSILEGFPTNCIFSHTYVRTNSIQKRIAHTWIPSTKNPIMGSG